MKNTVLCLLATVAICAVMNVRAQQPTHRPAPMFDPARRPAEVQAILADQAQPFEAAAKPTAMVQRMVASVVYDSTAGGRDSFRYFYFSPSRGAAHNPKNTATYYPFDYSPTDTYDSTSAFGGRRTQYIQCDSIRRYDYSAAGTLTGSEMLLRNQYNAANRLTQVEHFENGPTTPMRRYILSYNPAGDPVSVAFYQQYPTTTLTLFSTQTTAYNAQHHPTIDSTFNHAVVGAPDNRILYTYDASGRLAQSVHQDWTAGAWQPSQRTTYFYNAAGLLRSYVSDDYAAGAWTPEYKDSFVYTGNNPSFTAEYGYEWNTTTSAWSNYFRTFAHLSSTGNWDTVTSEYYDMQTAAWEGLSRFTITYNSYNNWETFTSAYDDNQNGVINAGEVYGTERYYYELWDNTLAMPNVSTPSSHITLSPNPVAHWLHVDYAGEEKPERFVLTDLGGRTVASGRLTTQGDADLSGLAPGLYIFKAIGADGAVLHTGKVLRN